MKATVSVRERGGRWQIRIRAAGRREITESLPISLPEDAVEAKAAKYRYRIGIEDWDPWIEGLHERHTDMPWVDALKAYEENKKPMWTQNTRYTTLRKIRRVLGNTPIDYVSQIHPDLIEPGLRGVSMATRRSLIISINAFGRWCEEHHFTQKYKPVKLPPKRRKSKQHVTREELDAICAAGSPMIAGNAGGYYELGTFKRDTMHIMADIALLAYHTGMRIGEILSLRIRDTATDFIQVGSKDFDTKSKRDRKVPIVPGAREAIIALVGGRSPDDWLCTVRSYKVVQQNFKAMARAALGTRGEDISLHSLRHTFVINLIQRGFDLYEIAKVTGHTSIKTLEDNYADYIHARHLDGFIERYQRGESSMPLKAVQ